MKHAFRAEIIDFLADPHEAGGAALRHFPDGLLVVEAGRVAAVGDARTLLPRLAADTVVTDYSGQLLLPGFVDTHIHYPQCDVIASYGEQLLDWLNNYTFPAEKRFADERHARSTARFFIDELQRNGTTTAMVFATVHPQSVDALFAEAGEMRLVSGKVLMDRNAPADLCDTAQTAYDQSRALIQRWHGKARFSYALTPRFAPTSSEAQLETVASLLREFPDLHVQTHVAENRDEVAWVAKLFPWSRSYLDVYDHYGLLRPRTVLAHCLHLDRADQARMGATGAAMAFCPTSNLFLGSGLFDLAAARQAGANVSLATDVGAGTSFSMLQTMNEAYKVLQMKGQKLSARESFYLATLGGARALRLDAQVGNLAVGKEADFIVLDPAATPLMARRMACAQSLDERLFIWMMLGDDRAIRATHILGDCVFSRQEKTN